MQSHFNSSAFFLNFHFYSLITILNAFFLHKLQHQTSARRTWAYTHNWPQWQCNAVHHKQTFNVRFITEIFSSLIVFIFNRKKKKWKWERMHCLMRSWSLTLAFHTNELKHKTTLWTNWLHFHTWEIKNFVKLQLQLCTYTLSMTSILLTSDIQVVTKCYSMKNSADIYS